MNQYQELYKKKRMSAEQALELIQDGDSMFSAQAAAEPQAILSKLQHLKETGVKGTTLNSCLPIQYYDAMKDPEMAGIMSHNGWFFTAGLRDAQKKKLVSAVPQSSTSVLRKSLQRLQAEGRRPVVLATVSPMDSHGYFSLSVSAIYEREMCIRDRFGGANSPAAVVIFCLLLSCRFVHYNYRMADTLRNMAAAFALLTLGPALAPLGGPLLHLLLNLFCIGVLLLITADQPELGNASLYLFSYLFLYGNPVSGRSLALRGLEMLLGFALCAAVLYHNHRGRTPERPFRAVLRAFSLADEKCRWQLRVAVGISLAVLTGELLRCV